MLLLRMFNSRMRQTEFYPTREPMLKSYASLYADPAPVSRRTSAPFTSQQRAYDSQPRQRPVFSSASKSKDVYRYRDDSDIYERRRYNMLYADEQEQEREVDYQRRMNRRQSLPFASAHPSRLAVPVARPTNQSRPLVREYPYQPQAYRDEHRSYSQDKQRPLSRPVRSLPKQWQEPRQAQNSHRESSSREPRQAQNSHRESFSRTRYDERAITRDTQRRPFKMKHDVPDYPELNRRQSAPLPEPRLVSTVMRREQAAHHIPDQRTRSLSTQRRHSFVEPQKRPRASEPRVMTHSLSEDWTHSRQRKAENLDFDDEAFDRVLGNSSAVNREYRSLSSTPSQPMYIIDPASANQKKRPISEESEPTVSFADIDLKSKLDPLTTPFKTLKQASRRLSLSLANTGKTNAGSYEHVNELQQKGTLTVRAKKSVNSATPQRAPEIKQLDSDPHKTPHKKRRLSSQTNTGSQHGSLHSPWKPVVESPLRQVFAITESDNAKENDEESRTSIAETVKRDDDTMSEGAVTTMNDEVSDAPSGFERMDVAEPAMMDDMVDPVDSGQVRVSDDLVGSDCIESGDNQPLSITDEKTHESEVESKDEEDGTDMDANFDDPPSDPVSPELTPQIKRGQAQKRKSISVWDLYEDLEDHKHSAPPVLSLDSPVTISNMENFDSGELEFPLTEAVDFNVTSAQSKTEISLPVADLENAPSSSSLEIPIDGSIQNVAEKQELCDVENSVFTPSDIHDDLDDAVSVATENSAGFTEKELLGDGNNVSGAEEAPDGAFDVVQSSCYQVVTELETHSEESVEPLPEEHEPLQVAVEDTPSLKQAVEEGCNAEVGEPLIQENLASSEENTGISVGLNPTQGSVLCDSGEDTPKVDVKASAPEAAVTESSLKIDTVRQDAGQDPDEEISPSTTTSAPSLELVSNCQPNSLDADDKNDRMSDAQHSAPVATTPVFYGMGMFEIEPLMDLESLSQMLDGSPERAPQQPPQLLPKTGPLKEIDSQLVSLPPAKRSYPSPLTIADPVEEDKENLPLLPLPKARTPVQSSWWDIYESDEQAVEKDPKSYVADSDPSLSPISLPTAPPSVNAETYV